MDWYDHVLEQEQKELEAHGFTTYNFQFRGFWSQGDGASYCGTTIDPRKFLDWFSPDPETYPFVRKQMSTLSIMIERRSHHYCHENTVELTVYVDDFDECDDDAEPLQNAMATVWNPLLHKEATELEEALQTFMRKRMKDLYDKLEEEYEYQQENGYAD